MELFLWVFLWIVASRGGLASQLPAIPMSIPMAGGLGWVFPSKLPAIRMGVPMARGLGRVFSWKLPAIPMAIPMGVPWLVAKGGGFTRSCQVFLWAFLWLVA